MLRHTYMSPETAVAIAEDFYAAIAKAKIHFCGVHFTATREGQKPLVIMPPKGVSAQDYRQALLTQADAGDHAKLIEADAKFRTHIDTARGDCSGMNEKTLNRAVINAVVACDFKL